MTGQIASETRPSRNRRSRGVFQAIVFIAATLALTTCRLFGPFTLSPPSWIHGTWSGQVEGITETWTFTPGNVIWTTDYGWIDFIEYEKRDGVRMTEVVATSEEYAVRIAESRIKSTFQWDSLFLHCSVGIPVTIRGIESGYGCSKR